MSAAPQAAAMKAWYLPAMCRMVVGLSKLTMRGLNRVTLHDRHHFDQAWENRTRGLLTISNHVCLLDDPLLTALFGVTDYPRIRWVGADARNFFRGRKTAWFFGIGKCIAIERGAGATQPGMDFLAERLAAGDWVHMFPEGGRTRDPEFRMRATCKPGIGRLISETQPLVLPYYHRGMQHVLPIGARMPRAGKRVSVRFGAPTVCDAQWVEDTGDWTAIAAWTHRQLSALEAVEFKLSSEA